MFLTFPELASLYGKDQRRRNLSFAQRTGAIISSLPDLTTWLRALYEDRLFPPKQQRALESLVAQDSGRPIVAPSPAHPLGFGLAVSQVLTELGTFCVYQAESFGSRTVLIFAPASGIAGAIGVNSATDDDQLVELVLRVYETLQDEVPRVPRRVPGRVDPRRGTWPRRRPPRASRLPSTACSRAGVSRPEVVCVVPSPG